MFEACVSAPTRARVREFATKVKHDFAPINMIVYNASRCAMILDMQGISFLLDKFLKT